MSPHIPSIRYFRLPLAAVASVACMLALAGVAVAQQGYGSYYGQNYQKYHGQLGTQSTTRYLYDTHFYHRPSVSPYLNLGRGGTMSDTAYQAYVRPEQIRREQTMAAQSAYIDARKREGKVGETRFPGATYGGTGTAIMKPVPSRPRTPSAYYNHWYGGWKDR